MKNQSNFLNQPSQSNQKMDVQGRTQNWNQRDWTLYFCLYCCSTQTWKKKSMMDVPEDVKTRFQEVFAQFESDNDVQCLNRLEGFVRRQRMTSSEFKKWMSSARNEFFPNVWVRTSRLLELHLSRFLPVSA